MFHKFLNIFKISHFLSFIFYNYLIRVYYIKESNMKHRIEFDSIGKIKVPGDKYWGLRQKDQINILILEIF